MKKIIFVVLALVIITSCKPQNGNVWTKEYEEKQFNDVYRSLEPTIKNPEQRKQFTTYAIKNLKRKLPNGLESISSDSLRKLAFALGKEYTLNGRLHSAIAWSVVNQSDLRNELEKDAAKKISDPKLRSQYCDCLITQLKKHDPDSLTVPIPDSIRLAVNAFCDKGK